MDLFMKCADLVNNLYNHNNYYHFAIKLYNKFILPIIDIVEFERQENMILKI